MTNITGRNKVSSAFSVPKKHQFASWKQTTGEIITGLDYWCNEQEQARPNNPASVGSSRTTTHKYATSCILHPLSSILLPVPSNGELKRFVNIPTNTGRMLHELFS